MERITRRIGVEPLFRSRGAAEAVDKSFLDTFIPGRCPPFPNFMAQSPELGLSGAIITRVHRLKHFSEFQRDRHMHFGKELAGNL